ncbi:MAG TPA: NAD(P)H-hydrate dehydratase [Rhodanobacteraceae bacterium]|nr:NAD(P)H-hydrate dehydratase [Rhodanobacteraceae bacterium]
MSEIEPARALYTAAQARALDAAAIAGGIAGSDLMRRAAAAALAVLRARWPEARRIVVLAGPGNNGGDGFLLAALARAAGLDARVQALTAQSGGDAATAREVARAAGVPIMAADADAVLLSAADVYVDALYGSGLNRAPTAIAAALIAALQPQAARVLALDLPSGLDADTGMPRGVAVRAAATVCFVGWKRGLYTGRAAEHVGVCTLATLDLPHALLASQRSDAVLLAVAALPPRDRAAHKGAFGHVLVIGGDHGMGGAARLAGEAALRTGAGLVSVATRAAHVPALLAARPELMVHAIDAAKELTPLLARASVLALGPGLGQGRWGEALFAAALVAGERSVVVDADALNQLARAPRRLPMPAVLTPHPGEAARLLGSDIAAVQGDRYAAARALAARYGAVVVLKGAGSLIADPAGRIAVCPWGNPGMAAGGMGDVLTGVIAALLAQGLAPWDAACLGAGLHARAGDAAARSGGERGLCAMDLFVPLRALLNGAADA